LQPARVDFISLGGSRKCFVVLSNYPRFAWIIFSGGYARAQAPSSQPDLGKLAEEAQGWLADMVRINTSNPPGNEMAVANIFQEYSRRRASRMKLSKLRRDEA